MSMRTRARVTTTLPALAPDAFPGFGEDAPLARGVDPVTVQARLGHASIATTNIYLHHLGSSADRAGLARLNALGGAGGARETRTAE